MTEFPWTTPAAATETFPNGHEMPLELGSLSAAREAFEGGCALFDLSWRDRFRLIGTDAVAFLHGQCTQDIAGKSAGEGGYAFVLDPRGKVLSDLRFQVLADGGILGQLPPGRGAEVLPWLERFVINRDVRFEELNADWALLGLAGPRTGELLEAAGLLPLPEVRESGAPHELRGGHVLIQRDEDFAAAGARIWVEGAAAPALAARLTELGAVPTGWTALEAARVRASTPRWDAELGPEVLPEECGQKARAVSFTKGCYCGQEAVAKQHFLGKPRRVLARIAFESDTDPRGWSLQAGDKPLARLHSWDQVTEDRWDGLTVIKGSKHAIGDRFAVFDDQGEPRGEAILKSLPLSEA